ncbi:UTP4 [Candida pseudojiufengensis]|uniref:UTP4 n=1 Tax=Candida pseudojiufengensis TaxID=497109 RepID=UPI0022257CDB|nr:UTP4 [Candida pseudojiufengensis]KAI5967024.1 UTP4 [Candida pseudojiufengensis]
MSDSIETIKALSSRSNYGSLPRPPAENRVKLYGLYKQATEGDVKGLMPRPVGFSSEDEGAKKKWDAWKREEGLPKTEAKKRYISFLIETMKIYASGTLEARELLHELEYLWEQIKDLPVSDDENENHLNFPSSAPSFSQIDRYSNRTPSIGGNIMNLNTIYSHSRRNTSLSLNDYVQQQRLQQQHQPPIHETGSQNVAGSLYSLPPRLDTNNVIEDFKNWQGEVNTIINRLTREFVNSRKEQQNQYQSDNESEVPLDEYEITKRKIINILKVVGYNALKILKNFAGSLFTILFIVWCFKKNVIVKRTLVRQPSTNGKQKQDLIINMVLNTDENKWFIRLLMFSNPSDLENLTPSNLKLAVGRSNGDIEIWNPKYNWTHELTLFGSKGRSIEGLCWTKDSRLFSIGGSTYITEWDLKTGKPLINYDCNAGIIWSIDVNESNDKLAVGCDDGSVVLVDISGGIGSLEYNMICQRQDARVLSIKWNKNDQIVGGCADGRIRVWSNNPETKGRILGTMRVDKSKTESTLVWSLDILKNKNQLISGDSTGHIKIWDLKYFTLIQSFKIHDADILTIVSDVKEEKFYSAGIDRKIHQFELLKSKSNYKWVHTYNRLLHANDIRSMAIFESKNLHILVSGGVERAIIVQNLQQFHDGKFKKLLVNQQKSNVVLVPEKNLVLMWQDQLIKIWKLIEGKHKLISKLILSDNENITSVDFKNNLIAVAKMTSVKFYELDIVDEENHKYMINKIRDENFDSQISGAKLVKFIDERKVLILTTDEELYQFSIDIEKSEIELIDEIQLIESTTNINNLVITPNHKNIIISRFDGSIEIYNLFGESRIITKLSSYPHLICCHNDEQLLVLTEENKIYEFNLQGDELLSAWSKRNSEFLPRQFLTLDDKPQGMFVDDNNLWIYGNSFLSRFDLNKNIPINKANKNITTKKRNRDGLSVDETEESQAELSIKQSETDKLRQSIIEEEEKAFWITDNY